jgi:hypothetical protein
MVAGVVGAANGGGSERPAVRVHASHAAIRGVFDRLILVLRPVAIAPDKSITTVISAVVVTRAVICVVKRHRAAIEARVRRHHPGW